MTVDSAQHSRQLWGTRKSAASTHHMTQLDLEAEGDRDRAHRGVVADMSTTAYDMSDAADNESQYRVGLESTGHANANASDEATPLSFVITRKPALATAAPSRHHRPTDHPPVKTRPALFGHDDANLGWYVAWVLLACCLPASVLSLAKTVVRQHWESIIISVGAIALVITSTTTTDHHTISISTPVVAGAAALLLSILGGTQTHSSAESSGGDQDDVDSSWIGMASFDATREEPRSWIPAFANPRPYQSHQQQHHAERFEASSYDTLRIVQTQIAGFSNPLWGNHRTRLDDAADRIFYLRGVIPTSNERIPDELGQALWVYVDMIQTRLLNRVVHSATSAPPTRDQINRRQALCRELHTLASRFS
jgi:hypothetical protein